MEDKTMIDYHKLMALLNDIEAKEELRSTGYRYNAGTCFKLIYAVYGRVCEVVKPRTNLKTGLLSASNFEVYDDKIRIFVNTEKQRSEKNIKRGVWVSKVKQPDIFFSLLKLYQGAYGDEPFFDVSYRWVELKFKKYFSFVKKGENVHCLRHWSATHYLMGFHTLSGVKPSFNKLALHGGWSSYSVLYSTYHHLVSEDYKGDY